MATEPERSKRGRQSDGGFGPLARDGRSLASANCFWKSGFHNTVFLHFRTAGGPQEMRVKGIIPLAPAACAFTAVVAFFMKLGLSANGDKYAKRGIPWSLHWLARKMPPRSKATDANLAWLHAPWDGQNQPRSEPATHSQSTNGDNRRIHPTIPATPGTLQEGWRSCGPDFGGRTAYQTVRHIPVPPKMRQKMDPVFGTSLQGKMQILSRCFL